MSYYIDRKRQVIRKLVVSDIYIHNSTLSDSLITIQSLIKKYGENARFDKYYDRYSDDNDWQLALYEERPETDDEMNSRIEQAEQKIKEQELKQLANLKAKYEAK